MREFGEGPKNTTIEFENEFGIMVLFRTQPGNNIPVCRKSKCFETHNGVFFLLQFPGPEKH